MSLRPKIKCEICGESSVKALQYHHIIPQTEPECTNDNFNIAVLCANCHTLYHAGELQIIGVFPSTAGHLLVYIKGGICNVPALKDAKPYYQPKPKAMRIT